MKLAQILREKMLPDKPADVAKELAGTDPTVQTQMKKQLELQQSQQDQDRAEEEQTLKQSVQALANVPWNPKDSRFQKLSAKVLGAAK